MTTPIRTRTFLLFVLLSLPLQLLSCKALTPQPVTVHMPTVTWTSTATYTPVQPVTATSSPTISPIPQPEWVTDFAQPILEAIAERPPDFQDDFNENTGRWIIPSYCAKWRMKYQGGELVTTGCEVFPPHAGYNEYAIELDGRLLSNKGGDLLWQLYIPLCMFDIHYDGSASMQCHPWESSAGFDNVAKAGTQSNHILVIAKRPGYAFYINGQPLYYLEIENLNWGSIGLKAYHEKGDPSMADCDFIVAFDNFKIWDLSDISIP